MKLTEKQLQEQILALLHSCGVWCFLTHKVGAYQHKPIHKGISDIVGIFKQEQYQGCRYCPIDEEPPPMGIFLAIEVKKPGGKVTMAQQEFIDTVNHHGGIGFAAESCEDVIGRLGLPASVH